MIKNNIFNHMIDRKLLKVINFILLIIKILNVFYFETASMKLKFISYEILFVNYEIENLK